MAPKDTEVPSDADEAAEWRRTRPEALEIEAAERWRAKKAAEYQLANFKYLTEP